MDNDLHDGACDVKMLPLFHSIYLFSFISENILNIHCMDIHTTSHCWICGGECTSCYSWPHKKDIMHTTTEFPSREIRDSSRVRSIWAIFSKTKRETTPKEYVSKLRLISKLWLFKIFTVTAIEKWLLHLNFISIAFIESHLLLISIHNQ